MQAGLILWISEKLVACVCVCDYTVLMAKINARSKGANGELEVAALLQRVVNEVAINCGYSAPKIRRNVEQSQIGGEDLVGLPWYSIEVKRCERVELDKWWAQTLAQARRKTAGSSAWDCLVKGGWRRVAAGLREGGSLASREAAEPVAGQEAAQVPSGEGGGSEASQGVAVAGQGMAVPSWPAGGKRAGLGLGAFFPGLMPKPAALGLNPELDRIPAGRERDLAAMDLGRLVMAGGGLFGHPDHSQGGPAPSGILVQVGEVDSRPVYERQEPCGHLDTPNGPDALKAPSVTREPILIWRQNRQPWAVRCILSVILTNGQKMSICMDISLDVWLDVLRVELAHRVKA